MSDIGSTIQQLINGTKELLEQRKNNLDLNNNIKAKIITNTRLVFNNENFKNYPLNKLTTFNRLPNDIKTEILKNKDICSKIIDVTYPFIINNEEIETCKKICQTFKESFKENPNNIELPSNYIGSNGPNKEWFGNVTEEQKDLIYGFEALAQLKEFSKNPTKDNLDKLIGTIKEDIKNEEDKTFYGEQAKKIVDDAIEKIEDFGKMDELLELSYELEKKKKEQNEEDENKDRDEYIKNKKIEFIKNKSSEELIKLLNNNNESFINFIDGYIEENKNNEEKHEDISKKILNTVIINNGKPEELFNQYSNSINFDEVVDEFKGRTYAEEIVLSCTNKGNDIVKKANTNLEDQVLSGKKIHESLEQYYNLAELLQSKIPVEEWAWFSTKKGRQEDVRQKLLDSGIDEQEIKDKGLLVTDKEFEEQLESLENNKKKTEEEIKSVQEGIEKLEKEIKDHEDKYSGKKWRIMGQDYHKKQMSEKQKEVLTIQLELDGLRKRLEETQQEIKKVENQKKQRDEFVESLKNIKNSEVIKTSKEVDELMEEIKDNSIRIIFELHHNKSNSIKIAFMNRIIRKNNPIMHKDFKGFAQQAEKLHDPKNKYSPLTNLCSNKEVLNSFESEQINSLLFGKIFSGNKTIKEIDPDLIKILVTNLNDENFEKLLENMNNEQKEELFGIVASSIQDHVSNKNVLELFNKLSALYNNSEEDLKEKIIVFFEQQISNLLKNEEELKKNPELMNKLLETAPKEAFIGFEEEDLKKLKTIKITPEVKEKLKENFKDRKNCLEIIEGLSVKEEKDISDFEEEEEEKEKVVTDKKNSDPGIRKQEDYTVPPLQNEQAPTTPKQQGGQQQTLQPNRPTIQKQKELEEQLIANMAKAQSIATQIQQQPSQCNNFGPHPVGCGCGCCCCKCHCCPCCCSPEISINNLKARNELTAAIRELTKQLKRANDLEENKYALKTPEAQAGENVKNQLEKKTNAKSVEYKNKEENIEATLNFNQTNGLECVEVAENFDKNNSTRTITFTIKENNINKEKTSAVNFLG